MLQRKWYLGRGRLWTRQGAESDGLDLYKSHRMLDRKIKHSAFRCEVDIVFTVTFSFWKVQMVSLDERCMAIHVAVCLSGCGGPGMETQKCSVSQ